MTQAFVPRFREMVAELAGNSQLKVVHFKILPPARPAEIKAAQKLAGGSLPEAMEAFYSEMNGFRLRWSRAQDPNDPESKNDRGAVDILPLQEVLEDWKDSIWFEFEGGERYKPVKPLDFFVEEACSALVLNDGTGIKPAIYYHYLGEFLCDTGYSFGEYIERLLTARGYWYWITTLCLETCKGPQAQNFLRRMPALFPDFQPALFQPGVKEERE